MVVAPGVSVDCTSFPGKSGTSASAPLVLGATLLAAERATTGAYINWPEMMRASVYAAATNPVDGAITPWIGGGSGDLRRGAGALDASALVALAGVPNIAPNGVPVTSGHYARTYTFASDFGATGRSYDQYFMKPLSSAITGARLRVAIAFDATANGCAATDSSGCSGATLDGDLDLQVVDDTGIIVCASTSYDSSYETCDFATNGFRTYRARLIKYGTSQPFTYVGIAWRAYQGGI